MNYPPIDPQIRAEGYTSLVRMFQACKEQKAWATYEKYLGQLDAIDHPEIKKLKKCLEAELKEATIKELVEQGNFEKQIHDYHLGEEEE